ncbi:aggregation-promoting factor C-terminal-like domain-containing protein [Geodermatophilus sp. SYSU D01119]
MRSRTRTAAADAPATVEASAVDSTAVESVTESTDTAVLDAVRPARARRARRSSPPMGPRRPALLLGAAAAGALVVGVLSASSPAASAGTETVSASVSVAEQLGIPQQPAGSATVVEQTDLAPLEDLAASRSQRSAEETTAAQAQAAADQAELDRRAAEEAARIAAEQEAARRAAEEAARAAEAAAAEQAAAAAAAQQQSTSAAAPAPAASAAPAARGSFKEYAMSKVGSGEQFSCLESLWGKESGWNPNAQNPSSTAYGIPQFLDSTWASTGIAKTSDGYRQIDAGLIYIEERYGSPCAAWAHSQSTGWY